MSCANRRECECLIVQLPLMLQMNFLCRFGGSEIPTECAKQVNQLIEPGSLDTPLAYVDSGSRSRGSGKTGAVNFFPRTGADIGYMDSESHKNDRGIAS